MDVTTFDALFSATCFTLLGLWWGVVQRQRPAWSRSSRPLVALGGGDVGEQERSPRSSAAADGDHRDVADRDLQGRPDR